MQKFQKIHSFVYYALIMYPDTRANDFLLYAYVCEFMGKEIHIPLSDFALRHAELDYPSYETVTRCRRKIQSEHPELSDLNAKKRRSEKVDEYKEYAKE